MKSSASSHFAGRKPVRRSHQRIEKPVGMVSLHVALDALGAKHAAVEGKLLPWLEPRHAVVADLQLNAALLAAEAAMGLYELLAALPRLPFQPPGGV